MSGFYESPNEPTPEKDPFGDLLRAMLPSRMAHDFKRLAADEPAFIAEQIKTYLGVGEDNSSDGIAILRVLNRELPDWDGRELDRITTLIVAEVKKEREAVQHDIRAFHDRDGLASVKDAIERLGGPA